MRTGVVRADLERLITSHNEADLLGRLVREQTNVACPSFLPFRRGRLESEQLGTPGWWMSAIMVG